MGVASVAIRRRFPRSSFYARDNRVCISITFCKNCQHVLKKNAPRPPPPHSFIQLCDFTYRNQRFPTLTPITLVRIQFVIQYNERGRGTKFSLVSIIHFFSERARWGIGRPPAPPPPPPRPSGNECVRWFRNYIV